MSKLKDFSRSQAVTYTVTYTVKVVISRKCVHVWDVLLQTTMAYHTAPFPRTLSDLKVIYQRVQIWWFFVQMCSSWQDFNWHSASRDPSAMTELLVCSSRVRIELCPACNQRHCQTDYRLPSSFFSCSGSRLSFLWHVARADSKQDYHRVISASLWPPSHWRRPCARPCTTWLM